MAEEFEEQVGAKLFYGYTGTNEVPITLDEDGHIQTDIISGEVFAKPQLDTTTIGALWEVNQTADLLVNAGRQTGSFQIQGDWVGTIVFERCLSEIEFAEWFPLPTSNGNYVVTETTENGIFVFPIAAAQEVRMRVSAWTEGIAYYGTVISDGAQVVRIASPDDPTKQYKITDIDSTPGNQYFGYVDVDGKWYIMNLTATAARYVKGDTGYTDAWGDRDELDYDYFNNIF